METFHYGPSKRVGCDWLKAVHSPALSLCLWRSLDPLSNQEKRGSGSRLITEELITLV